MAGTPPSLPYSWHAPEALEPPGASSGAILSAEQIERWRTTGALVLDGLLPAELVARAKMQAEARYPAPGDTPPGYVRPYGLSPCPRSHIRFPMDSGILGALNEVTLEPRLLTAAAELLGTTALRVTQSNILPKYGEDEDVDQVATDGSLHHDYGANQFLAPPQRSLPEAVIVIICTPHPKRHRDHLTHSPTPLPSTPFCPSSLPVLVGPWMVILWLVVFQTGLEKRILENAKQTS